MSDKETKKKLQAQYSEREIVGGVYAIKNMVTDARFICASTDMQGSKNRFEFAQKTKSCVEMKLQKEWAQYGGDKFCFEVLEELKKDETQTAVQFKAEVELLKEMWTEKQAK